MLVGGQQVKIGDCKIWLILLLQVVKQEKWYPFPFFVSFFILYDLVCVNLWLLCFGSTHLLYFNCSTFGPSLLDFRQPATVNTLNLITTPILITINQKRQEPAIALTHFLSHLFSQFRSFSEFRH
ncbi:hypothetical protein L1887_10159 [Cichorium endivia]|nr:hypothetical protein L1887_10159 [Cichorium endivia]